MMSNTYAYMDKDKELKSSKMTGDRNDTRKFN